MTKGIRSIKRGIAVLLSACMVFGMTPIQAGAEEAGTSVSGNETQIQQSENENETDEVQAGAEEAGTSVSGNEQLPVMGTLQTAQAATPKSIAGLGTDRIADPTAPADQNAAWRGSYVYFGSFGTDSAKTPVKYRVLDSNTTAFGGNTILLDCDSILWAGSDPSSAFDADSNGWGTSAIRTYLNGAFLNNNFTTSEQDAIAASTKSAAASDDGNGLSDLNYAALNSDKLFLLDAKEATKESYGYSNTDDSAANRVKTGGNDCWWLRSASVSNSTSAGCVSADGYIYYDYVGNPYVGVSPALNINLSSVLFSSVLSGTAGETGAEYKLTLLDKDMTIAGKGKVTRTGDTITVPYSISGTDSGNATRVSMLFLDQQYAAGNTKDTKILGYGALETASLTSGTGTFTIPSELSDKVCGTDYYAYIIAEDVNGEKKTDYASEPVQIAIPDKPWEAPTVKTINLGTAGIVNPARSTNGRDAWKGCYVYFGSFDADGSGTPKPVKYRVLDSNTTAFGGNTMLLDCDSVLWAGSDPNSAFDADSNDWGTSDIRTYLNGAFINNNFTTSEQNAIAASTKITAAADDGEGYKTILKYAALSNDKLFFLDAQEAMNASYGYRKRHEEAANRVKTGGNACWWLRSASIDDSRSAGCVYSDGYVSYLNVHDNYVGVSPALNVNLSSVLFSSASGTSKSSNLTKDTAEVGTTTGTEWKLTLSDAGKTVKVTDGAQVIEAADGKLTVPYTYTDTATTEEEKVNQISVMVTDKQYTDSSAVILYYGALQNTDLSSTTGTGTFALPGGLAGKTFGTDYHVYLLAEHTTDTNATDYASPPTELTTVANEISKVELTDIAAPTPGTTLDTTAVTTNSGISQKTPAVTWYVDGTEVTGNAKYHTVYTASVTLGAEYGFAADVAATVNGQSAQVSHNNDGTITISYEFPATPQAKLTGITPPQAVTGVANGTEKTAEALGLPSAVTIQTEDADVTQAAVTWNLDELVDGSYSQNEVKEQRFTVKGTVTLPEGIEAGSVSLEVTIDVTVSAAGFVGTPSAGPAAGTYTEDQTVTLTSSTEGAKIYYTLDGSEPVPPTASALAGSNTYEYTTPISMTGTSRQTVTTTIKAVAVKDGMLSSSVAEFTYTINLPAGETFGEVDANNHVHTTVKNRKEATCTQTGYTGDTYCTDCDKLLGMGKELAALGHDYKAIVTKQPTTTEEGIRTYTCTRCNSSYTESIAKLPEQHKHEYTETVTKEPTCTDTGLKTFTCSCGDSYTETISVLGHSYTSKVTKAATTTEEGIMTYTCSKCGHSYTQPVAKIKIDDGNKDNGNQNQNPKPGIDNGNNNSTSIKPYIKDDSGKEGWDVIKPQLEKAKSGETVTVAMNGTSVVPKTVIDSIKGKDTTLVLDMGNGLSWKINGKEITDAAGDIDFGVTIGADAGKSIPVDVINMVSGERYSMNLSLAYDGEFGFTATLTVNMGPKNSGMYANLFYYNEQTGKLEFVSAGQIDSDGNVELAFTHASDYTIVVEANIMSDNSQADNNADETIPAPKTDDNISKYAWNNTIIIIIGICIILIIFGAVFYVRKKSGSEEE